MVLFFLQFFSFSRFTFLSFSTIPLGERTVKTAGPAVLTPASPPPKNTNLFLGQRHCTEGRFKSSNSRPASGLVQTIRNFWDHFFISHSLCFFSSPTHLPRFGSCCTLLLIPSFLVKFLQQSQASIPHLCLSLPDSLWGLLVVLSPFCFLFFFRPIYLSVCSSIDWIDRLRLSFFFLSFFPFSFYFWIPLPNYLGYTYYIAMIIDSWNLPVSLIFPTSSST